MSDSLDALRARIDALDRKLLELLVERAEAARAIGSLKAERGATVLDPGRERQLLERLHRLNQGRYPPEALTTVFREILSASRSLEAPIAVGYLGRPGGFAEMMTARRFGASSTLEPFRDPAALLGALDAGRMEYALIAREVGDEDPALTNFDLFLEHRVTLFGEAVLHRGYALLTLDGAGPVRRIHGHPAALARCRGLLERHPEATVLATAGSREAAANLATGEDAALAPEHLADGRRIVVAESGAEDEAAPRRRFLILARSAPPRSGRDRTALVCVLPNRPGALADLLRRFTAAGANLAWIEIRESRHRPWEHAFFLELDGHAGDPATAAALREAAAAASHFQVLGSYPVED